MTALDSNDTKEVTRDLAEKFLAMLATHVDEHYNAYGISVSKAVESRSLSLSLGLSVVPGRLEGVSPPISNRSIQTTPVFGYHA